MTPATLGLTLTRRVVRAQEARRALFYYDVSNLAAGA